MINHTNFGLTFNKSVPYVTKVFLKWSVFSNEVSLRIFSVFIGRKLLSLVFGSTVIHELYTSAAGFYVLWLLMRMLSAASAWYPVGWEAVYNKVKTFTLIVSTIPFLMAIWVTPKRILFLEKVESHKNSCPSNRDVRFVESLFIRFYFSLHQSVSRTTGRLLRRVSC